MADNSTIVVYHNPGCSKSRCVLAILEEKKLSFDIVEYMKNPLTAKEIGALVGQLKIAPESLVRKGEKVYKEQYAGKKMTAEQWFIAMSEHPELIERPIVLRNGKAVIGRPAERIEELF